MANVVHYIPTLGEVKISGPDLVAAVQARWPSLPVIEGDASPNVPAGSAASLKIGGEEFAAIYMPIAIPWPDLEWPSQTSAFWPTASEELKRHDGVIHVVSIGSDADALSQMCLLTHAVSAVLTAVPTAIGVYNGDAHMVTSKEMYMKMASMLPGSYPILLWLNFCVGPQAAGSQGYTIGMETLGFPNLETSFSPEPLPDLRIRLMDLCGKLIKGLSVEDGKELTGVGDRRIVAARAPSTFDVAGEVVHLHFLPAA